MNSIALDDLDIDEYYDEDYSTDPDQQDNTIQQNSESKRIASFLAEIEPIIKQCIKNYFFDKNLKDGRKISNEILELPYYLSLLVNTTVSDGVNKAYNIMEDNSFLVSESDQNNIAEDVRYMINLIKKVQRHIPQEFVGGMILMHLELIEGMEIW
jgi:hypothetical protein